MEQDDRRRVDDVPPAGPIVTNQRGQVLRFLVVGGLSFLIDLGLLVLLHEYFAIPVVAAAPTAFLISLIANYLLQRMYAFRATTGVGVSAAKYVALVLFNTLATSVIVSGAESVGLGYEIGKVVSTGLMTVWNFFLYKHWIFKRNPSS